MIGAGSMGCVGLICWAIGPEADCGIAGVVSAGALALVGPAVGAGVGAAAAILAPRLNNEEEDG